MRRWIKYAILLAAALALSFGAFWWWASSGTRSDEEMTAHTSATGASFPPVPDTLTVMTYNIGYLSGLTNNQAVERSPSLYAENLQAAVELIRASDPDMIGFQEIDFGARRSLYVDQLDTLAALLGYPSSGRALNWDERYLPWPSLDPNRQFGRVLSGQAVLSRYPIQSNERIVLERPPHPFYYDAFYLDRLAQVVRIDVGRPLILINVHLEAFDEATREEQAQRVRALYEKYRTSYPVLLIGDFNSIMPTARESGRLSSEVQAQFATDVTLDTLLQAPHLREAFPDSSYAMFLPETYTYPSNAPQAKIDHIFYDASQIKAVDAYVVSHPSHPSDHRAVAMDFVFRGSGSADSTRATAAMQQPASSQ